MPAAILLPSYYEVTATRLHAHLQRLNYTLAQDNRVQAQLIDMRSFDAQDMVCFANEAQSVK